MLRYLQNSGSQVSAVGNALLPFPGANAFTTTPFGSFVSLVCPQFLLISLTLIFHMNNSSNDINNYQHLLIIIVTIMVIATIFPASLYPEGLAVREGKRKVYDLSFIDEDSPNCVAKIKHPVTGMSVYEMQEIGNIITIQSNTDDSLSATWLSLLFACGCAFTRHKWCVVKMDVISAIITPISSFCEENAVKVSLLLLVGTSFEVNFPFGPTVSCTALISLSITSLHLFSLRIKNCLKVTCTTTRSFVVDQRQLRSICQGRCV
ncbi:unnamed protein product [Angiostrongylus costaricensis]|uniref:Transmembrane protein n=1 Tax=Angiostrongylus costaricensis TaxID=334426 RepID=A0A0R3PGC1_ANGCS|nr:unnamed protein product [Angiostrongylus costaricensis]